MKVFVGICNSQKWLPDKFVWSLMSIATIGEVLMSRGTHPWDVVRNNQLINEFLKTDADVFVKMDIDQEYPPGYFLKMLPLVEHYKVIGPLIYDRWQAGGFVPLAFRYHNYPKLEKYDISGLSGVHAIPYTHTNNFYAREVLKNLKPPYYEAFLRPDGLDRANHVDFTFLDKIKAAGYSIFCNLDVVVKHIADMPIGKDEHEIFNRYRISGLVGA